MADNKPHPATPKRREEFRKEGKFPKARDTTAIAAMLAVVVVVVAGHDVVGRVIDELFRRCHGDLAAITRGDGGAIGALTARALLTLALPPALAAAIAGGAAGMWQSGFRFYPDMMKPKPEKLNPLPQLGQMFNPKHAGYELAISSLRVGIVGCVCYLQLKRDIPSLLALTGAPLASSLQLLGFMILRMTLWALAVLVVLAVIDYGKNRYTLEREMRMSDQDIKDEQKQQDQDPKLKGKMRQKMREASRQRIIAAVGQADVVITNPTHVAVALRYSDADPAPILVAKGHDALALRIRTEARKHGIAIIENRALARAIDAEVEIGAPIPGQHYVAVAKVLAFVFNLRQRRKTSA